MYISDAHLREFLLDAGLVNKAAFEKATREAQAGKRSIGEILVANGDIGQDELRRTYAYILGIPFLSLKGTKIPYETLSLIPEPVARRNNIIAYSQHADELEVAMLNTDDLAAIDFIKKKTQQYKVYLKFRINPSAEEGAQFVINPFQRSELRKILQLTDRQVLQLQDALENVKRD